MSAFCLYINEGKRFEEPILNTIRKRMIHFSWVEPSIYSGEGLQLISTVNKTDRIRIFRHQEQSLTFFLQGDIFESSKGIERIDEESKEHSLEQQLIDRYLKNGISSCVGLNGTYNLLVWNGKTKTLDIAGDRIGIYALLFTPLNNNRFIVTTDIMTLKNIPGFKPRISKRGIFDLLYMGIAYENRTVLEGVERLLPNACYRVCEGKLKLLEEFRLPFSKDRWDAVPPKIFNELDTYYTQAVKRQLRPEDKIVFCQSGGKDSRVFSHFLKKAGIVPHCVTMGKKHHGEVFLAKNVCKILGFPWRQIPLRKHFDPVYALKGLQIDSFSNRIFATWAMELIHNLTNEWDYVISAFLADPYFGSGIKDGRLELGNSAEQAFDRYHQFWRTGFLSEAKLKELFPEEGETWIAQYKKESFDLFRRLADEPFQMIMAHEFRSINRFKIGSIIKRVNAAFPMRFPYTDIDLTDFLFSLPPALLHHRLLLEIFLQQRSKRLGGFPLDRNSPRYEALVPSLKAEIKTRLWSQYVNKIKLPLIRRKQPYLATTQFYQHVFSLHHKGFQEMKEQALTSISSVEGLLDISKAKGFLENGMPEGMDHILPGNATRSLMTAVFIAEALR